MSIDSILVRINNLYTVAAMIENEGNCDIRSTLRQGALHMIREIEAYYNPPEDVTPVPVDQAPPKKRGRKKKETISEIEKHLPWPPEPESEDSSLDQAPPEPEPVSESEDSPLDPVDPDEPYVTTAQRSRSLVYDSGCLEKKFPRVQDITGITDEWLETSNISPVVLANSCTSKGEHPFFKGPAAFIWYLEEDRRKFYLAGLFDDEKFYPSILDLIDAARLKEADAVGPDMSFVASVIDPDTLLPVEPTLAEDDPEAVNRLREGGMKRILDDLQEAGLDNEQAKTVARFMTRFGIDAQVEEDLGTVASLHLDPMEKNPDVRF